APLWNAVTNYLVASPAAVGPSGWAAFEDLRCYADVERRLHAFDEIDMREFGAILSLKCADVRIGRDLVWSYCRRSIGSAENTFWRLYDQCWELIEDLED